MSEPPKFEFGKARYDMTTFSGRLRHFLDVIDPRTLLTSSAELEEAVSLLEAYKAGRCEPGVTDEALWRAQKVKQAIIHPDTGEKIWAPFRMSGFVPFGAPVVVGLLLPNLTLPQTAFWQWLNQSHNACVNYANRNASKPTPVSRFLLGYTGAVTSAVAIALGLTVALRRMNSLQPAVRTVLQRFVPLPAVEAATARDAFTRRTTASVCNVVLMRNNELSEGIDVLDSKDNVVGTSTLAAKKALKETALTRAFLPCPILLLPPIVMTLLDKTRWLARYPRLGLPVQAAVTTAAFGGALPVAIALFPQMSSVRTAALEPHIRAATAEDTLFYNKGL